jgi:hypothetical protein
MSFAGGALAGYFKRLMLWRTRRALLQLNDHMLRDIGLSREDIEFGRFPSTGDPLANRGCR